MLPGASLTPFRLESARSFDGVVVTGMPVPAPEERIAVLFADPYSFPADAFAAEPAAESAAQLGGLPLTGGLAGAAARGGGVRRYLDGQAHASGAVGIVIGGRSKWPRW